VITVPWYAARLLLPVQDQDFAVNPPGQPSGGGQSGGTAADDEDPWREYVSHAWTFR
jgi:hypothetical protein